MNGNELKKSQLGVSHGAANNQLKKSIMFALVKKLKANKCYHCKLKISSIDEFSIEHKKPWLHDAKARELFFDLKNIAFSHFSCNIKAGRRAQSIIHGSVSRYRAGCRCQLCLDRIKIEYKKRYPRKSRAKKRVSGAVVAQ